MQTISGCPSITRRIKLRLKYSGTMRAVPRAGVAGRDVVDSEGDWGACSCVLSARVGVDLFGGFPEEDARRVLDITSNKL